MPADNLPNITVVGFFYIHYCRLLFRVSKGYCSKALVNVFVTVQAEKPHTRSGAICIPKHCSTKFNNSFLCKGVVEWSKLTSDIKNLEKQSLFVKKMKLHFINNY